MKNRIILEKTRFSLPNANKTTTDLNEVKAYMDREGLTSLDGLNTNAIDDTNTTGAITIDKANIEQDNVSIDKGYFSSSDVNILGVISDDTIAGVDTNTASQNADNSNNSESIGTGGVTGGKYTQGIFGA